VLTCAMQLPGPVTVAETALSRGRAPTVPLAMVTQDDHRPGASVTWTRSCIR
jgi:hypothetical protein